MLPQYGLETNCNPKKEMNCTVVKDKARLPEVLHVSDVAKFLGLHEKTVCAYIREGKIRAIRCGRCYRIRREWLRDYIDSESAFEE